MTQQEIAGEGGGRVVAMTGVTGFIGGHLAGELARRGWRLRALVRSMPRLSVATGSPIEIVQGDLADAQALRALVDGADAIVHLAGAIKARNRDGFMRANAVGTEMLAAAWQDAAPKARFLHLSSMAAREPGLSHYAASKQAAEACLQEIRGDWCILRPAAVYGPGDRETLRIFRLAAGLVQPMLNGAGARVSLIEVTDLMRAMAAMLEQGQAGRRYELTDMRRDGYSWGELSRAAAVAVGHHARPVRVPALAIKALGRFGDLAASLGGGAEMLTSQKAREILHPDWSSSAAEQPPTAVWQPRITLENGFAGAVAWYRAAGWLAR